MKPFFSFRFVSFRFVSLRFASSQAIVMTMPSVCADETHCPSAFDTVELVAVAIFTLEYVLRVYAAPEAYPVSEAGISCVFLACAIDGTFVSPPWPNRAAG